jgi:hypothetical protein
MTPPSLITTYVLIIGPWLLFLGDLWYRRVKDADQYVNLKDQTRRVVHPEDY